MPFFIRKPFSLLGGLVKINLSRWGVGVSVGVKGLRAGIQPSGAAYIYGGRYGIYYKKILGKILDKKKDKYGNDR